MNELLPCPFCGGKAVLKINQHFTGDYTVVARCSKCVVIRYAHLGGKNKGIREVISKWNTRHYPPEVQQAVERMEPKKAIRKLDGLNCPRCDMFQTHEKKVDQPPFCWRCGQALDWSGE